MPVKERVPLWASSSPTIAVSMALPMKKPSAPATACPATPKRYSRATREASGKSARLGGGGGTTAATGLVGSAEAAAALVSGEIPDAAVVSGAEAGVAVSRDSAGAAGTEGAAALSAAESGMVFALSFDVA